LRSKLKEDENLRRRFEPSAARQRCFSNGPQGNNPLSPTILRKGQLSSWPFCVSVVKTLKRVAKKRRLTHCYYSPLPHYTWPVANKRRLARFPLLYKDNRRQAVLKRSVL